MGRPEKFQRYVQGSAVLAGVPQHAQFHRIDRSSVGRWWARVSGVGQFETAGQGDRPYHHLRPLCHYGDGGRCSVALDIRPEFWTTQFLSGKFAAWFENDALAHQYPNRAAGRSDHHYLVANRHEHDYLSGRVTGNPQRTL